MDLKNIECVVFDLDGTIFDTEEVWKKTSLQLNEKYNINMDDSFRAWCCGRGDVRIILKMQQLFPNIDAHIVREEWENMVKVEVQKYGPHVKTGFENLLQFLQEQKVKLGIATGSTREETLTYFKSAGMDALKIFDVIIAGDDVEKGKPNPDAYILASQKLGVSPQNCLCVEDSPNGAEAGLRAGFNVIVVPDIFQPTKRMKENCLCFNDLNEVKAFLMENQVLKKDKFFD